MKKKFEVIFLEEGYNFLENIEPKAAEKIIFNIDKASYINDPKLFKKLTKNIWEFRTLYQKKQYRLLAFWDKRDAKETLVITTHGFIKKSQKTPKSQIYKAEESRKEYFEDDSM